MSDFQLYFETGLWHVLNKGALDHILFLIVLTLPYAFKEWRKVLLLVTLFTIGHTMSLILSVFGIIKINTVVTEFLIPLTILATAFYNIIIYRKKQSRGNENSVNFIAIVTLFFGIIHGLGFFSFFKIHFFEAPEDSLVPVLEFSLGIEAAQVVVIIAVLLLSAIAEQFFRVSRRDWILVISSFVTGVVVPMIIDSEIW